MVFVKGAFELFGERAKKICTTYILGDLFFLIVRE